MSSPECLSNDNTKHAFEDPPPLPTSVVIDSCFPRLSQVESAVRRRAVKVWKALRQHLLLMRPLGLNLHLAGTMAVRGKHVSIWLA